MKTQLSKIYGMQQKTVLKAKLIVIQAFLKKRKVSNQHPSLAPKRFRKRIHKAQSRLKKEKSERK